MSFEISVANHQLTVKCSKSIIPAVGEQLAATIKEIAETEKALGRVVLDFGGVHDFDQNCFRSFTQLGLQLRKRNISIYFLAPTQKLKSLLSQHGMAALLQPIEMIEELPSLAVAPTNKPKPGINVEFINPFVQGTVNTLKIQCSLEVRPEKPTIKDNFKPAEPAAIAGVIGISSPTFKGSIAVAFPTKTFLGIMGKMLGENYTEITKDLEDGAGELMNIIFGHAKKVLNEQGHKLDKALPTVIRGEKLSIHHMAKSPTIVLPFTTDLGAFFIEVGADQSTD